MFIILTYDVNVKRVKKVKKACDKYLGHIQNSVYEGNLTEGQLNSLKKLLEKLINKDFDSVCIYKLDSIKYAKRDQIGLASAISNIL